MGASLIAQRWGPSVGGIFLAFPAIFPASATLIEKHATQKKERAGLNPGYRGIDAAALDARGSAMGSSGLILFAALAWKLLPRHDTWIVLGASTLTWLALAMLLWCGSKLIRRSKW